MEKISTFIKKHDNISVIIVIIFTLLGICLNVNIYISDELWNYQNICKMLNGYKIYTDANVIVTPLFHFIGFIILKIFGTNILVFRIYNILILTFVCFFIYLIIKELCNSKFRAFTYLLVILYEIISIAPTGANYNTLAMGFVLLGTYLNLKWIKNKETHNIIYKTKYRCILYNWNINITNINK